MSINVMGYLSVVHIVFNDSKWLFGICWAWDGGIVQLQWAGTAEEAGQTSRLHPVENSSTFCQL